MSFLKAASLKSYLVYEVCSQHTVQDCVSPDFVGQMTAFVTCVDFLWQLRKLYVEDSARSSGRAFLPRIVKAAVDLNMQPHCSMQHCRKIKFIFVVLYLAIRRPNDVVII